MHSPIHIVFGTNAAFSHVPSFTKLAKALVSRSSDVVISIILHVNNVENVEKIISDLPAEVRARIKTFSVGEILPWKEVPSKGMMSLLWESGKAYGAVLAVSMNLRYQEAYSDTAIGHRMACSFSRGV